MYHQEMLLVFHFQKTDRFGSDTQITATLIAVGTTATTGQVSVTFTYVQANNLQDATAV
jgi:hypothetical protein